MLPVIKKSPVRELIEKKRNGQLVVDEQAGVFPLVAQRIDHQALWKTFLDTARSYFPPALRPYLTLSVIDLSVKPPRSLSEYAYFLFVEESIAPIRVMFTASNSMSYFEVPSIGNAVTRFDWFWETASIFESLDEALLAADDRFKERAQMRSQLSFS